MAVIAKIAAAIMLFLALGGHPYSFFIALRWIVSIACVISAIDAGKKDKSGWAIFFGAVAILFNPILPIHMSRGTWLPIDVIVGIILLISIGVVKED